MKNILLILLTLALANCAIIKKPTGPAGGKKAILVEGLASYQIGFVRNSYQVPLEELGYQVYSYPYTFNGKIEGDVCIGHSFGGGLLMKPNVKCGVVFTLDAREWDVVKHRNYVSTHKVHYNYYQTTGLRGYLIKKAINEKITGTVHIGLPKEVKGKILEIIKGLK